MRKKSLTKIQVQENTAIIAKFAARLLILIILIGVIIYARHPKGHTSIF